MAEAPITSEVLERYAIDDGGSNLETVLKNNAGKIPSGGLVSVISSRNGVKPEKEKKRKRGKENHNRQLCKRRSC